MVIRHTPESWKFVVTAVMETMRAAAKTAGLVSPPVMKNSARPRGVLPPPVQ